MEKVYFMIKIKFHKSRVVCDVILFIKNKKSKTKFWRWIRSSQFQENEEDLDFGSAILWKNFLQTDILE